MTEQVQVSRRHALQLVEEQYESIHRMSSTPLDRINRVRPESMKYYSVEHLLNEAFACANAVSWFAVALGLITSEEARQVILKFQAAHPELHPSDEEL